MPAARPERMRPRRREETRSGSTLVEGGERPCAAAISSQPIMEGTEDMRSAARRPRVLRTGPTIRLPTNAPRLIKLEKKAIKLSPMSSCAETEDEKPSEIPRWIELRR